MSWEMFYLTCFAVGLVLSLVSFLGGFTHLHFGHHVHLGAHTHVGGSAHGGQAHAAQAHGAKGNGVSPINGFTIIAFLCWFGGTGYLLERYGGFVVPAVLAIASLSGLAGGALIFWFLARVLMPHERELTAEETEMIGVVGRVSGGIREEGTGEILFTQNGARHFAPARSESGRPIARDAEVVVMRYERGIAYVRRWDELNEEAALNPGEAQCSGQKNEQC